MWEMDVYKLLFALSQLGVKMFFCVYARPSWRNERNGLKNCLWMFSPHFPPHKKKWMYLVKHIRQSVQKSDDPCCVSVCGCMWVGKGSIKSSAEKNVRISMLLCSVFLRFLCCFHFWQTKGENTFRNRVTLS